MPIMAEAFTINVQGFKGLDERAGCSTGISSLPRLVNMSVDENGALVKRCGYRTLSEIRRNIPVTALWKGEENGHPYILAACGNAVYISVNGGQNFSKLIDTEAPVHCFISFGGKPYCLGGELYRCGYSGAEEVSGYVPTVVTSCSPDGAGTPLEAPNMLTAKRRALYNGDGSSDTYTLPEKGIVSVDSVRVDGALCPTSGYTVSAGEGTVVFAASSIPQEGLNNVEFRYTASDSGALRDIVAKCKYGVVFENRLFLYGNPELPDKLYRSEPADGIPSCEYFTELGYHAFEKSVTALVPCYNRLLIFFADAACFTFAQLQTDSLGNLRTSFPVYELHSSKGNVVAGLCCSFWNTPVTLCRDGLNKWVSTVIADERSAVPFSARARGFLAGVGEDGSKTLLFDRKSASELWLCTTGGVLVYNYALDCFCNYGIAGIRALCETAEGLLVGMADGRVCLFSKESADDAGTPIAAEFETPYCSFGAPFSAKSLFGVSLALGGGDALSAEIRFKKGNGGGRVDATASLTLDGIHGEGFRRLRRRVCVKRFYSLKLCFSSQSEGVAVKSLHLFGNRHDGAQRLN